MKEAKHNGILKKLEESVRINNRVKDYYNRDFECSIK